MALKLYRRHRTECEGGHPEDSRSGEFEEGRRGWKRCGCLIHASGTVLGKFSRKQTGKSSWDEARTVAVVWETSGGDGEVPAAPPKIEPPAKTTIERAVLAYLAERAEISAPNTLRKNRFLLNKLKAHSEQRGYVLIEQWTPLDVREFRALWKVSPHTASKNMTIVKSFFEFAVSNEWLSRSPARLIREVRGKATDNAKERIPFSDEEIKRMFEACETLYGKMPIRW